MENKLHCVPYYILSRVRLLRVMNSKKSIVLITSACGIVQSTNHVKISSMETEVINNLALNSSESNTSTNPTKSVRLAFIFPEDPVSYEIQKGIGKSMKERG